MSISRYCLFFIFLLSSSLVYAGSVVKAKGKKVYIVFDKSEGGTFAVGDLFNLTGEGGKKVGVVELKKVKGLKAIGLLRKGKAEKGNGTLFRSVSKKTKKMKPLNDEANADEDTSYASSSSMRWGAQFTYGSVKEDVQQSNGVSNQTGSLLGLKGLIDYPLFSSVHLQLGFGIDQLSASGQGRNVTTNTDGTVTTKIMYLGIDGLMQLHLLTLGSTKVLGYGGLGMLQPLSKSSESIDPGTIGALAVGEVGAGLEFPVGTYSVPVQFIYYIFPKSETVSVSVMALKIGIYF